MKNHNAISKAAAAMLMSGRGGILPTAGQQIAADKLMENEKVSADEAMKTTLKESKPMTLWLKNHEMEMAYETDDAPYISRNVGNLHALMPKSVLAGKLVYDKGYKP